MYERAEAGTSQQSTERNAPWSLHFDRDGTEDVGVILDVNREELLRSRHFWRPGKDAPTPPTLVALRTMKAAPKLLATLTATERFVSGFEGDELQEGVGDLLAEIHSAIAQATDDSIGRVA